MRRDILRLACVFLLLVCCGVVTAEGERTLRGRYVWTGSGEAGDLEAVFTAAGEGKWSVDFRFAHGGDPHVYSGTAEGSLTGGALQGKVSNEGGGRQFTFQMKFEDGQFRGTHAELKGDREQPTGTLNLG